MYINFYLGQVLFEDHSPGDNTSDSSEKLLKRDRGRRSIYMILEKGDFMQSSTYLYKRFLLVMRSWCQMKRFSAFLDMRRCKYWSHKINLRKCLTIWRPVLGVFPKHRGPPFWLPTWTYFRMCKRSTAAETHDLIL